VVVLPAAVTDSDTVAAATATTDAPAPSVAPATTAEGAAPVAVSPNDPGSAGVADSTAKRQKPNADAPVDAPRAPISSQAATGDLAPEGVAATDAPTPAPTVEGTPSTLIAESAGQVVNVPLTAIQVPDGPPLKEEVVLLLLQSILAVGLLQALTINRQGRVISGRHRLEALRRLGWTSVHCRVLDADELTSELATIDENLVRADLTILRRAEQTTRKVEILEALGLRRRVGGQPAGTDMVTGSRKSTAELAAEMGLSERTLQRYELIAGIPAVSRDKVRSTSLSWSTTALLKIANTPADQQPALIDSLLAEFGEEPSPSTDTKSLARSTARPPKRRKKSQKPKPAAQKGGVGNKAVPPGFQEGTEFCTTTESKPESQPAIVEVTDAQMAQVPESEAEPKTPQTSAAEDPERGQIPFEEGTLEIDGDKGTAHLVSPILCQVSRVDSQRPVRIFRSWCVEVRDSLSDGITCLLMPEIVVGCRP
jgi:ParB family chromosome partitioning protein